MSRNFGQELISSIVAYNDFYRLTVSIQWQPSEEIFPNEIRETTIFTGINPVEGFQGQSVETEWRTCCNSCPLSLWVVLVLVAA